MAMQTDRPTTITPDTVRKLEQAFRDGLNVSQACLTSGVGRTAYYEHFNADEEFANKMTLAQQYVTIKAKRLVVQEINDGNLGAAKWWLEHKARDEFGNQPQVDDTPPLPDDDDCLKQSVIELRRAVDVAIAEAEAAEVPGANTPAAAVVAG